MLLYALWAFGGWCGTPYPGWYLGPRPHPDPEPWWVIKVVSIIGGIAGGWMATQLIGADINAASVLTTIAGSFITGGFLGGAVRLIMGPGKAAAGA